MKKRAFERTPINMQADFFYNDAMYTGIVKNISKNGMYIETSSDLPFKSKFGLLIPVKSKFELRIPFNEEFLEFNVKLRRIVKTDGNYDGMGIEILNPTQKYLEFFSKYKSNI